MYHSGRSALPVKPVARRTTWVRPIMPTNQQAYLQKRGRCPLNRHSYPIAGVPAKSPAQPPTVGTWIPGSDMSLEPGRQFVGASILDPMSIQAKFIPSMPSTVTVPAPSSVWNPIESLVKLWDARPQVLKDIRLKVDPNTAMRLAQNVVRPGQVTSAVNQLNQWGVQLDYRGMPISGQTAGFGYQLAGINWSQYLPWIIGGGVVLLMLPMVMGRK